jgi:hypothetical protein
MIATNGGGGIRHCVLSKQASPGMIARRYDEGIRATEGSDHED